MFRILQTVLILVVAIAVSATSLAAIPEALRGSWIVDKEAMVAAIKARPDWKAEDAKNLPMMMGFMAKMNIVFSEDGMTTVMGKRKEEVKPVVTTGKNGEFVLKITDEGRTTTLIGVLDEKGRLKLGEENKSKMETLVLKKGTLAETTGKGDADLMTEMMKLALENGGADSQSKTPEAKKEPADKPDYSLKYGRLTINHLSDTSIAEINTAVETKLGELNSSTPGNPMRVELSKACTQEDFEKISGFPWIQDLTVSYGNEQINSLAPLAKLKQLKKLELSNIKSSKAAPLDLTPLAGLSQLEELNCHVTRVKNTQALNGLVKLKNVNFYMSHVDSIEFMRTTPDLVEVDLYGFGHTFKNYEPLLGLKKLKKLNIYMNKQATDELLAPLAALTSLEEIRMSNSRQITSLGFLKNCRDIKTIHAAWSKKLTDISALADKDKLEVLQLADCAVTDFSALKGKKSLRDLDVSGTAFADLSVLQDSTSLTRLTVSKDFPPEQIEELKKTIPTIRVRLK